MLNSYDVKFQKEIKALYGNKLRYSHESYLVVQYEYK